MTNINTAASNPAAELTEAERRLLFDYVHPACGTSIKQHGPRGNSFVNCFTGRDYVLILAVNRILAARLAAGGAATECECPPCPGRGNDGHGLTHCAECCFGTGVEADITCPVHGEQAYAGGAATNEGLRARIEALPALTEGPNREGTARWPECCRLRREMTVGELREALAAYPDYYPVVPIIDGTLGVITATRAYEVDQSPAVLIGECDIPFDLVESMRDYDRLSRADEEAGSEAQTITQRIGALMKAEREAARAELLSRDTEDQP